MQLGQPLAGFLDVDGEGFPVATGNLSVSDQTSRTEGSRREPRGKNNENGEIIKERVVVLRKPAPSINRRNREIVSHPSACYGPNTQIQFPEKILEFGLKDNTSRDYLFQRHMRSFPLLKEHRLNGRFRIKEAIRLGELLSQSTKGPESFAHKLHQQRELENNIWNNPSASSRPFSTSGGSSYKTKQESNRKRPTDISVSIWEEFRYGSAIFNSVSDVPVSHGRCEWARPVLERFLAKSVVDIMLYIIFFAIYFVSCVIYNDFLELGVYLLFDLHMRLHETADRCRVRVHFNGSVFQGPVYCFVRMFCQHCVKVESDKVVLKLMKKMKQDIAYSSSA